MLATAFRSKSAPLSNDQIAKYAPSVFATEPHDSRGERYAFIPTLAVLDGLRREGFQPYEVAQTRCRDESKREFTKHMVRLRHPDQRPLKVGDVFPEIVLTNSHDGSSAYQLMSGLFRLACSNGMVVPNGVSNDIRVRHSGKVVDDVIEGSFRVLDDVQAISNRVEQYRAITLSRPEQTLLAQAAHEVRWGGESSFVQPEKLLNVRRFEDRNDDLWTTFNRIQENVIKGGVHGRSASGRNQTSRAVQGVNENVRLNRALFTLADEFAKLKSQ